MDYEKLKITFNSIWELTKKYYLLDLSDKEWESFIQENAKKAEEIKNNYGEDAYHYFNTVMTSIVMAKQREKQRCANTEDIQKKKQISLEQTIKECLTKK